MNTEQENPQDTPVNTEAAVETTAANVETTSETVETSAEAAETPVKAARKTRAKALALADVETSVMAPVETTEETPAEAAVETTAKAPVKAARKTRAKPPALADVETSVMAPVETTEEAPVEAAVETTAKAPVLTEVETAEMAPAETTEEAAVEAPAEAAVKAPVKAAVKAAVEATAAETTEETSEEAVVEASPLAGTPDILIPALKRRGFEKLTPVQLAIANADDGRRDLRISSQTGSGKTVAIGFSMIQEVVTDKRERSGPTTLVIAPTRELAMQVKEELSWLFADLQGVDCEVVTGGTPIDRERQRLRRKPSVLVGTPGRLLDHLRRGAVDISSVKQLVLDEADQMLDLGFKDELDGILECLPEERRTHLVSATFPPAVLQLANRFQNQPIMVQGTAPGEAHDDIEHIACRIGDREHYQAVVNMLLMAGNDRTLVFVRTREETTRMAEKLAGDGFAAAAINGDLAQAQRTRTLAAFRSGRTRTLIATDVAARGLDIPAVTMVIHVEQPMDSSTYVHRSGRTGRAGQKGQSVLLVPKSRAQRTTRMFRQLRLEPRWTWAPNAELINKKQLERAEEEALAMLAAAPAATATSRASAANLLRERDPIEVVAALLTKTMTKMCSPFDMAVPKGSYDDGPRQPRNDGPRDDAPRHAAPRENYAQRSDSSGPRGDNGPRHSGPHGNSGPHGDNGPRREFTPRNEGMPARSFQKLQTEQRGTPGSAPSWQRPNKDDGRPVEAGFTRFNINWGERDGANPRRIMAHICRRGEVESSLIGSISMNDNGTTFEVQSSVADDFAKRVQRRDRRDPHLIIHRETFNRPQSGGSEGGPRGGGNFNGGDNFRGGPAGPGGYRGAMRTKQSR